MLTIINLSIINYWQITRASQLDNFLLAESDQDQCAVFTLILEKLLLSKLRQVCFVYHSRHVTERLHFALTLHGESLSRHGDVILALCGEAVMWQVVVLWEFHQRVICWGERLEKARTVEKNRLRSNKSHLLHQGWIKDVKPPLVEKDTSKLSGKQNIMQKDPHP